MMKFAFYFVLGIVVFLILIQVFNCETICDKINTWDGSTPAQIEYKKHH